MNQPPNYPEETQAAGEGVLVAVWTMGLLLAGLVVNGLAVASAAAGLPLFY